MSLKDDPDPSRATAPQADFYRDLQNYSHQVERLFARNWQLVPFHAAEAAIGEARPFTLLPGSLDEPLVLTHDSEGRRRVLSNVCTHRGALVVESACAVRTLRCRYHGRRFGMDGCFLSAPGYDDVPDFPRPTDDLPALEAESWGPLVFTALGAGVPFATWFAPVAERLAALPIDRLREDPQGAREWTIEAHWALYCENYLEGFHIPFVHAGLVPELDAADYPIECFEWGSLQVGIASAAGMPIAFPPAHRDGERRVAAFYFWLFPNLMLNFYAWGLSVNVVEPRGPQRTVVRYSRWVWDEDKRDRGPGADLDRVELEDQAVVQSVQRGVGSRLWRPGRLSPRHEVAVRHFHRLVARELGEPE